MGHPCTLSGQSFVSFGSSDGTEKEGKFEVVGRGEHERDVVNSGKKMKVGRLQGSSVLDCNSSS